MTDLEISASKILAESIRHYLPEKNAVDSRPWTIKFYESLKNLDAETISEKKDTVKDWFVIYNSDNSAGRWPLLLALKENLPLEKIKAFAPDFSKDEWRKINLTRFRGAQKNRSFLKKLEKEIPQWALAHKDPKVIQWFVNEFYQGEKSKLARVYTGITLEKSKLSAEWVKDVAALLTTTEKKLKLGLISALVNECGNDFVGIWAEVMGDLFSKNAQRSVSDVDRALGISNAECIFYESLNELEASVQDKLVAALKEAEKIHLEMNLPLYKDKAGVMLWGQAGSYLNRISDLKGLADEVVHWLEKQESLEKYGLSSEVHTGTMRPVVFPHAGSSSAANKDVGRFFGTWVGQNDPRGKLNQSGRVAMLSVILSHDVFKRSLSGKECEGFLKWLGQIEVFQAALADDIKNKVGFVNDIGLFVLYGSPDFWMKWRDEAGNNLLHFLSFKQFFSRTKLNTAPTDSHQLTKFAALEDAKFQKNLNQLLLCENKEGITPIDLIRARADKALESGNNGLSFPWGTASSAGSDGEALYDLKFIRQWATEQVNTMLKVEKQRQVGVGTKKSSGVSLRI